MNKRTFIIFLIFCVSLYFIFKFTQHKTYKQIFFKHKENVSQKWANYLDIYEFYLPPYINQNASILEIGVQNGGHLQILSKYLKNAKIYGLDIDQNVCKLDLGKDIQTFCFNATEEELINKNMPNLNFDVIIDDGSHQSPDVIKTFQIMFYKLKPGGTYIIEDMHASYWKEFQGGYQKPYTQIEYFKSLIDILNSYHINANNSAETKNTEFYDSLSDIEKEFLRWTQSITFYDSVAVVKKLTKPRSGPYGSVFVGKIQPIKPLF
ncbi:Putative O-methyltransferase I [Candidatus Phycorickettsia trachydisci]|uniref:O-methyltransferase I n=1 Tax=Candidatus Phycorickettsia trachydisci TaxID=2115978 RepID=A0A2P1P7A9_9RICK|nr:class I SAM-dependent methyltransferase [Candidatus Phycorickettsia trachydisci]AVP87150.1 Putative O-methyltransferase I [Candidatus Phycorickettsia trachydisci]